MREAIDGFLMVMVQLEAADFRDVMDLFTALGYWGVVALVAWVWE